MKEREAGFDGCYDAISSRRISCYRSSSRYYRRLEISIKARTKAHATRRKVSHSKDRRPARIAPMTKAAIPDITGFSTTNFIRLPKRDIPMPEYTRVQGIGSTIIELNPDISGLASRRTWW
ncbi:MAG: hypothetical protein KJ624_02855 [Chloroflexi bacterium]|nr:hypothetical protein [Chloroflexota bacterium]